jgi:hypothetical protein
LSLLKELNKKRKHLEVSATEKKMLIECEVTKVQIALPATTCALKNLQ